MSGVGRGNSLAARESAFHPALEQSGNASASVGGALNHRLVVQFAEGRGDTLQGREIRLERGPLARGALGIAAKPAPRVLFPTEEVVASSSPPTQEVRRARLDERDFSPTAGDDDRGRALSATVMDREVGVAVSAVDQQQEVDRSRDVEGGLALDADRVGLQAETAEQAGGVRGDATAL